MIATSAFRNAKYAVHAAMADPGWTAAVEQEGKSYTSLPPALIVDIDETVLDNSRSQAQIVKDRTVFDRTETQWNNWVRMGEATPIPGAVEFLNWAVLEYPQLTVLYVTNRIEAVKPATIANLKRLGFPLKDGVDVVLPKERADASSDKSSRRAHIAESYRIILLAGDDLGDFITAKGTPEERLGAARAYQRFWGERWVILPNPTYGSWERALYPKGAEDTEVLKKKFETLTVVR